MTLDLKQFVDRTIYFTGVWEPSETLLLRHLLKPGDRFIDVGANIGYFSLLASQLVGPEGHVDAIEATPPTIETLQQNLAANNTANVTLHPVAVADEAGSVRITVQDLANTGGNQLDFAGSDTNEGWIVPMTTLDMLLTSPPYAVLKMDIEGAEAKALRGADKLLTRSDGPDLVFEFTPHMLEKMGDSPMDLFAYLEARDYSVYQVSGNVISPVDKVATCERRQSYLFCRKASRINATGTLNIHQLNS